MDILTIQIHEQKKKLVSILIILSFSFQCSTEATSLLIVKIFIVRHENTVSRHLCNKQQVTSFMKSTTKPRKRVDDDVMVIIFHVVLEDKGK